MNAFKNIVITAVSVVMLAGCGDKSVKISSLSSEFQPHVAGVLNSIKQVFNKKSIVESLYREDDEIIELTQALVASTDILLESHSERMNRYLQAVKGEIMHRSAAGVLDRVYTLRDLDYFNLVELYRLSDPNTLGHLEDILYGNYKELDVITVNMIEHTLKTMRVIVEKTDKNEAKFDRFAEEGERNQETLESNHKEFFELVRSIEDAGSLIDLSEQEVDMVKDTKAAYKALMCPPIGECKALTDIEAKILVSYSNKYKN